MRCMRCMREGRGVLHGHISKAIQTLASLQQCRDEAYRVFTDQGDLACINKVVGESQEVMSSYYCCTVRVSAPYCACFLAYGWQR